MPEIFDVKILKADLSKHKFIYLIPLSDFHLGSPQCHVEAIRGYIDWIKQHDNAYAILNGDILNCAWKESTPELYEDLVTADTILPQAETLLKPIANRILGGSIGNHELSIARKTGTDYMWHLMRNLGREACYTRDGGVLIFRLAPLKRNDQAVFSVLFTHGWGGARTRGAKMRKLEYLTTAYHADIYILSHDHTENLARDNYIMAPTSFGKPSQTLHRKMLVASGGFLGYGGYSLRHGYQPQDLGTPRIRIDKKLNNDGTIRKDIHASI